jgi:hypothetical protein
MMWWIESFSLSHEAFSVIQNPNGSTIVDSMSSEYIYKWRQNVR